MPFATSQALQPVPTNCNRPLACIYGKTDVTNNEADRKPLISWPCKVAFARWRSPVIGGLGADGSVEQIFGKLKLL
jgi:hypothetical protein